ncbi:hypothetical protein HELRODRAFT_191850 [Helobdella robusta]|uniref:ATP synthase F1 subunit epsilon n=1 Tax=Helobdella robusta TaxID=6412 RepID=T1FTC6_HELRO|nr:hypothetical protein HELRODRAFT_191850 [Helobdella robusta]ESO03518.1 hypothetical protein HELRODRAFT_191850 [Helobdella robusta]
MSACKKLATSSLARRIAFSKPMSSSSSSSSDSQQPGWGSGSGAGGGAGGSIREAGGPFGKREAAKEEEYFRKLNAQQLETLKNSLHDEIKYHKEEIADHQKAIERHKNKLDELKKLSE